MRQILLIITVFVCFGFAADESVRQSSWWKIFNDLDLNRIVESGLKENHQLNAAGKRAEQAVEQSKVVRSLMMPSVYANGRWNNSDINGFQGGSAGAELPDHMSNRSVTLDARYRLDSWGEELQQYKSVKFSAKAVEAELAAAQLKLATEVTGLYFDAISAKSQIRILEKQKGTAEKQLQLMQRRYELGEISGLALLQQKQQLAALSASIPPVQLRAKSVIQYLSAQTLIKEEVLSEMIPDELPALSQYENSRPDIKNSPDVKAAEFREEAAKANFTKTKMVLIPTLELTGSAGWDYGDPGTAEWEKKWVIGASVSIPVFTGGAISSGYREGRNNYEAAVSSREQTLNNADAQLTNAVNGVNSYRDQVRAYRDQFEISQQLYRESLRQYRNGLTQYLDVLSAVTAMDRTEISLLLSSRSLLQSQLDLIKAAGGAVEYRSAQ